MPCVLMNGNEESLEGSLRNRIQIYGVSNVREVIEIL